MQLIILEGENKCGKTTIANLLVEKHGFKYLKCSQPKGDPYEEYMNILKKIERKQQDTVIDRFIYGELVYGPIYRGKSGLDMVKLRNLELKARAIADKTTLIYCFDRPEEIASRFESEKEEFATVKNIKKVLSLYDVVIKKRLSMIPFNIYLHQMKTLADVTLNNQLDEMVDEVLIEDRRFIFHDAVGNTVDPYFILVGDKHNDELKNDYQHLAQPFDFGVSSRYLFEELERANVKPGSVMLINSNSTELKRLKKMPPHIHVISLGRQAEKRLVACGIKDYVIVGHPAYEQRFHFAKHRISKKLRQLN